MLIKTLVVLRWLLLLPAHILLVAVAWLLAPIAVRWFSTADKLHLTAPFKWMETIDHDLAGDEYWQAALGDADPLSNAARIAWLRRNGGNTVNYGMLGVLSDPVWLAAYRSTYNGVITGGPVWWCGNSFCLRWFPTFRGIPIELSAGWNLIGPQNGRCKYWLSMRRGHPET